MNSNNGLKHEFPFYVDKEKCNACGECAKKLPQYFSLNGTGKYKVINVPSERPEDDEAYKQLLSVIYHCPMQAIKRDMSIGNPESEFL